MSDAAANVDLDDIQGLLRFGYGRHTEACFLLLRVTDSDAARRWLAGAPVASAATLAEPPPLLLQVALSNEGLRALQVPDAVIGRFSTEFVAGMSGNTSRERRLGDIGGNDPGSWVWGSNKRRTPIPRLPLRPPDDYLRLAMVNALAEGDVELELRLQLQTDPHPLPIENAGVLWPERLSPRAPVATLRIPRQTFDSPAQLDFAKRLSYNPWHCIAEHRPLGNQSRARRRMYYELSKLRHEMNAVPHYEPNGDESFA